MNKECFGYFWIVYKNDGGRQWLGRVMGLKTREEGGQIMK